MKRWLAFVTILTLLVGTVSACGGGETGGETDDTGSVYFLNFKPEAEAAYKKVAADFTEETGIPIQVVTAASGGYEQTLTSEIAKSEAPTIFQLNGPVGYEAWKDYCLDLSDTDLYRMLSDKSLAITEGDGVFGIPYTVEGYGIIYNDRILQKYFKMEDSVVESAAEINNFETLKAVVEDMTAKKGELGIEGVFASTSMAAGEQWRWQTHLANLPFYYEFRDLGEDINPITTGLGSETVSFSYNEEMKNIFDLYLRNSVTEPALIGGKTTVDSVAEFALGKAAMMQNGNWAASQISEVGGSTVADEDIRFLPIYIGVEGEENNGLCIGTENYLAINNQASEADQQASLKFLEWLFSSETGKSYVLNELGFIAPFDTFEEGETPTDPLGAEIIAWTSKDEIRSVPWAFTAFPSQEFKDRFGDALMQYAQGSGDWGNVVNTVRDQWRSEYGLTH